MPVPTLTGPVALTIPAGANSGTVMRLKGKGITSGGTSGDLYVKIVISLPEQADAELKKFAEAWKTDYDPRARSCGNRNTFASGRASKRAYVGGDFGKACGEIGKAAIGSHHICIFALGQNDI